MVRLDGGLATTLQKSGLPPLSPVEPWLMQHPERIASAHAAFVAAGSQAVLTATFMAVQHPAALSVTVPAAIALARRSGSQVWVCSGPVAPCPNNYRLLAQVAVDCGVNRLVLETFPTSDAGMRACDAVRRVSGLDELVLSVTVPTGEQQSLTGLNERACDAGATGVGINCVSAAQAAPLLAQLGQGPLALWAKLSPCDDWLSHTRAIADGVAWLGGCCGTHPSDLRTLWESL